MPFFQSVTGSKWLLSFEILDFMLFCSLWETGCIWLHSFIQSLYFFLNLFLSRINLIKSLPKPESHLILLPTSCLQFLPCAPNISFASILLGKKKHFSYICVSSFVRIDGRCSCWERTATAACWLCTFPSFLSTNSPRWPTPKKRSRRRRRKRMKKRREKPKLCRNTRYLLAL